MWESLKAIPFGRISRRKGFLLAAVLLVASLALNLISTHTAYAADATWNGSVIMYDQKQFYRIGEVKAGDPRGLPEGTVYGATTPAADGQTQKAYLIYFAPGADPPTATNANYAVYDYTPPDKYTSTGAAATTITLEVQSASSNPGTTSCDSGEFLNGIGWIVCPVTKFLAGAMDTMYDILSGFLAVRPMQTTQDNSLFRAWSYMRNFANIVFVIGFLIVIYSQVTTIGINNYGIKKTLPRLIIAAILVNISYWICAVAIDVSNILGYSFQDILINLRNSLVGTEGNGWDVISWQSITGFILSGGTAAVGAGIGAYVLLGGTVGAAVYMLVPILLTVLLAVIIALLVLALRQALITVLVIISPLAFVAYLLPNTEKYFEKWKDLFMTMLVMFPMLSIIFGGSQLAGTAIIQNADSINTILLGMAVQVAPVVVTPLLIKFSGALISRVAGMMNNPNKGLIDRTRKWAGEHADEHRARVLANRPRDGIRGFGARRAHNYDARRRDREGWKKVNEGYRDASWANDERSHAIHAAMERANMQKETGEAIGQAAVNNMKSIPGHAFQIDDVNLRVAKLSVDNAQARADVQFENLRANDTPNNLNRTPAHLAEQARQARALTLGSAVVGRQLYNAQEEQRQNFADALTRSPALQQEAGGIAQHGADSALAAAITASRKAYGQSVDEARQVLAHYNLNSSQRQNLALGTGGPITVQDSSGNPRTFTPDDLFAREAAIEEQVKTGTIEQVQRIVELSGDRSPQGLYNFRTTIKSAAAEANLGAKTVFLGGATLDEIAKGTITGPDKLIGIVQDNIAKGKFSADKLATIDKDALASVLAAASRADLSQMSNDQLRADLPAAIAKLKRNAAEALSNRNLSGKVAANAEKIIRDIENL